MPLFINFIFLVTFVVSEYFTELANKRINEKVPDRNCMFRIETATVHLFRAGKINPDFDYL